MTLPLTLWPDCPQESVAANESASTQIFGVMYITLTSLIDSMVPASRPWALLGKLLSYIVKLVPILWWALPAGPAGRPPASSQEPPTGWIPDTLAFTMFVLIFTACILSVPLLLLYHYNRGLAGGRLCPGRLVGGAWKASGRLPVRVGLVEACLDTAGVCSTTVYSLFLH
ncbi:hypothetical protein DSO57_1005728 [Entomophthora muscae]|uniref:Uncharacterized protein n=1 Tax=Entomophthora muscae TaxID=34485 RepID=A0ACC2T7V7_9FUNG|nr:hypothetical protein DSO57_1005728 [Entomophthora muscae]